MEDHHVGVAGQRLEPLDGLALLVVARIAAGGQHHADRRVAEARRGGALQLPARRAVEQRHQVAVHAHHQRLGLRVAEAHVELHHLRSAGGVDHQPHVEHSRVGVPLGGHAADRGVDDLLEHPLLHRLGEHRGRRVGAHAPGVLAAVAVQRPLVILGGGERHDVLAVGERVVGSLLALEPLLDHDGCSGLAEAPRAHDLFEGGLGLGGRVADRHPLAGGQAVGLHDAGAAERAHVSARRLLLAEDLELRTGNPVARHELPGEGLAPLEPSGRPRGAEDGDPRLLQKIREPRGERVFGPHHDGVRRLLPGQRHHRLDVSSLDLRVAGGMCGDRVAARRGQHLRDERALRDLPHQGVLAPSGSDHQHSHDLLLQTPRPGHGPGPPGAA